MLIEIHYGNDSILLVNGQCRRIHLLDYIRSHCHISSSITIDLCLINSGQPFHLSLFDSNVFPFEQKDSSLHLQCILTWIDDQGTYIPLLNNSKLITNEFLAKLKKVSNSKYPIEILSNPTKQLITNLSKQNSIKKRRNLKSIAIAVSFLR